MAVQPVKLPDRFYLPRIDASGAEVRDVVPWEGAESYVTDGVRVGIRFRDGRISWLGTFGEAVASGEPMPPAVSFEEDFEGVDLDALVTGIREYMERHPVLKTVWREDVAELDHLRRAETSPGAEGVSGNAA